MNALDINGVVVIGEGERDEAPMLYIGEEVGSGDGPEVDIALDPLEGVTIRWARSAAREGGDPAGERQLAREELTVADLCDRFIRDHSELYNKPSTTNGYRQQIAQRVLPALGAKKIGGVTRADIVALMRENAYAPTQANRTLALVKKMFNCAEVWGLRDEGTNPCRLVKMYKTKPKTRLLTDHEVKAIFETMDRIEHERIIHPVYTLVCRLQFAFAARINEILSLEWSWINFERGLIRWPDSKTGFMEKYLDAETHSLIENATSRGSCVMCILKRIVFGRRKPRLRMIENVSSIKNRRREPAVLHSSSNSYFLERVASRNSRSARTRRCKPFMQGRQYKQRQKCG